MSSHFLIDLFGEGPARTWEMEEDALPKDTEILNAQATMPTHPGHGEVQLLLQSKAWPDVSAGERIAEIRPTMRRVDK